MATQRAISEILDKQGLAGREAAVLAQSLGAVRLKPFAKPDTRLPAAGTKIGGDPDLPMGMPWPCLGDRPLLFLAQINVGEAGRYDLGRELPPVGLVQFFYAPEVKPNPADPLDSGRWWVQCINEPKARLRRMPPPPAAEGTAGKIDSFSLEFRTILTPPTGRAVERVGLEDGEFPAYERMVAEAEAVTAAAGGRHQLLGNPSIALHDLPLQCELAAAGIAHDGSDIRRNRKLAPYLESSVRWRLLLQIDTTDLGGVVWRGPFIYFYIPAEDLAARRFDRVRAVP